MAFTKVLWLTAYSGAIGIPSFLRVVQGGYSSYVGNEDEHNQALIHTYGGQDGGPYTFDDSGRAVFPVPWGKDYGFGTWAYCPSTGKFERVTDESTELAMAIKIGSYFGSCYASGAGRTNHRYYLDRFDTTAYYGSHMDFASFGDTVLGVQGNTFTTRWSYPFTSQPTRLTSVTVHRVTVHKGQFYGMGLSATNGIYIYRFEGSNWVQKLLQADRFNGSICVNAPTASAFFAHNGYLWAVIGHTNAGSAEMVTCWKIDPVAWTTVEVSATQVPDGSPGGEANWRLVNPYPSIQTRLQQVPYIDDSGNLQYVIVQSWEPSAGYGSRGWSVVEFSPTIKWPTVAIGPHTLGAAGGAIWDIDGGNIEVTSMVDHGTYVEINHRCSQMNNKNIDVGIRYQAHDGLDDDGTPCTPYTGEPSHEGDTNLSTKPTTQTLTGLSDDFSGVFDDTKFRKCNAFLDYAAGAFGWYGDMGRGSTVQRIVGNPYPIVQADGGIYFGTAPQETEGMTGAAVMLRWPITGAFQLDLTLDRMFVNPTQNLKADPSQYFYMFCVAMVSANKGWGWAVRSTSGTTFLGVGLYFVENGACVIKTGAHTLLDTNVMRISRSPLGAIGSMADLGGANEDLTPITPPALTEPVRIYFGAGSKNAITWSALARGPGFSQMDVYDGGGGGVGTYIGGVIHRFCWDSLADLGTVNKAFNILAHYKQNNP